MDNFNIGEPAAFYALIGVVTGYFFNYFMNRQKVRAEAEHEHAEAEASEINAAAVINELASTWIQKQEQRIQALETKVVDLKNENSELLRKMQSVMEDARADREAYIHLEQKYDELKKQYDELLRQHNRLRKQVKGE